MIFKIFILALKHVQKIIYDIFQMIHIKLTQIYAKHNVARRCSTKVQHCGLWNTRVHYSATI